jgi:hypothetical protein
MTKIAYVPRKFKLETLATIETSNTIIAEYEALGMTLTLRQLYYQLVSRDYIPNNNRAYQNLSAVISNARLAGLISWRALEDRTRFLRSNSHWSTPSDIIASAAHSFALDKWQDQETRVEVWIEKDALVGVLDGICTELDVPYFSCRGYTSQSEMWIAAQRLIRHVRGNQDVLVVHLGDHDPSGIDMTRDIEDRIRLFMTKHLGTSSRFKLERIALNFDQIEEYDPPPNPAKLADPRATGYIAEHGDESWELDALNPTIIADLVRGIVDENRDDDLYNQIVEREEQERRALLLAAENWQLVERRVLEEFGDE